MAQEPNIVLRCNRVTLYLGVLWIIQGALGLAGSDPSRVWDGGFLILGIVWLGYHLVSSITVTDSIVIIRRGLLQDVLAVQAFIDHDITPSQRRVFKFPPKLAGEPLRLPFLIRPGLIVESIMDVKGIERPKQTELPLSGSARSLF